MTIPTNPALQPFVSANARRFPSNSRYVAVPILKLSAPDGSEVPYLARRFVPRPEAFALVTQHTVVQGERLDHIAARYLGDPEQFWRLCDANGVLRPAELTEHLGVVVRITLPEGIPGPTHA